MADQSGSKARKDTVSLNLNQKKTTIRRLVKFERGKLLTLKEIVDSAVEEQNKAIEAIRAKNRRLIDASDQVTAQIISAFPDMDQEKIALFTDNLQQKLSEKLESQPSNEQENATQ